jgi:hypothetical protein
MTALPRPQLTREQLADGLNDWGDPYGLAAVPEHTLRFFAPMASGEAYRHELARRRRVQRAAERLADVLMNGSAGAMAELRATIDGHGLDAVLSVIAETVAEHDTDTKRAHVREAKTADRGGHRHTCHWPGCERIVPPAMWGCNFHWFRLPKFLRDDIWRTYRPGQEISKTPSREYVETARRVQDWIETNGR